MLLIDLGALDGAHGKAEMKTARKLVLEGLAHAAASDIHRPEDQTSVAAGMAWIRKQLGPAVLDQMLDENPRRAAGRRAAGCAARALERLRAALLQLDQRRSLFDGVPFLDQHRRHRPGGGDSTGISIFIDSRMTTVCPSATASPTLTSIFQTVPVMCAFTVMPWRAE